ncbi:MAG: PD40 domain-containing protein, partial [Lentisphaeria bacterium]|nr:PD40 domain-containing protein [Lentisphaeria bacterium]
NGTCNIRIVEIATGKTLFVTDAISGSMQKNGCHSPVFSPDGTKVLYVSGDIQPLADIMMYDLEKRQLKRMTSDGKDNQRPRWSSDGKRYIHTTLRNGKYCTAVKTL